MRAYAFVGIALLVATPGQAADPVSLTQAVATAERALNARAVDAEREGPAHAAYWEIELVRGSTLYVAYVDAKTGEITRTAKPRIQGTWTRWFNSDKMARGAKGPPLSELLARLERQTGGKVYEVEFETDNGAAWYEAKVTTAAGVAEVRIDPSSGQRLAALYDD